MEKLKLDWIVFYYINNSIFQTLDLFNCRHPKEQRQKNEYVHTAPNLHMLAE